MTEGAYGLASCSSCCTRSVACFFMPRSYTRQEGFVLQILTRKALNTLWPLAHLPLQSIVRSPGISLLHRLFELLNLHSKRSIDSLATHLERALSTAR